jgi:hypothetical protein
MKFLERIHYIGINDFDFEVNGELIFKSKRRKVFNLVFVIGIILFVSSMLLKAMIDDRWPAIPLGISTLVLFSGIWKLSASGKLVFDKNDQLIFRAYRHLGYFEKIYSTPLKSLDDVTIKELNSNIVLFLYLDNEKEIQVAEFSSDELYRAKEIQKRILNFINSNS